MQELLTKIVSSNDTEQCEKMFSDLLRKDEIENVQQMLDMVTPLSFTNKEFRAQFVDTINGFYDFYLFKMFETLSLDLNIHLSKKDRLSIFQFKNINTRTEQISQFADWAILRAYKRTPEWSLLAGRIKLQELKLTTCTKFSELICKIPRWFSEEAKEYINQNAEELDKIIIHDRDLTFNYMSLCTLIKSYLLKKNEKEIFETPQMMFLRTAIQQYMNTSNRETELKQICKVYEDLSLKKYSHASPTFFNSCSKKPGLSSCFLIKIPDDMEGILQTNTAAGLVSSVAGGLGFSQTDVRHGSVGALGKSSGVVKQAKMFNATLQYVDQNGKRPGAGAFYLEPWHIDILDFCNLKKATGSDSERARDNFYALWVNDLFMERVRDKKHWTLFCPKDTENSKGETLHHMHGEEFRKRYLELEENESIPKKVMEAENIWYDIICAQAETGGPFICYKDTVNACNNQDHLGVIKQSNLCTEITEFTSDKQAATCNLASITLKTFVQSPKRFNFSLLESACRQLVRNLDRVIEVTYIHKSLHNLIREPNLKNRPLGIGVNGFANLLQLMKLSWLDEAAFQLNEDIFETMLYACVNESIDLAIEKGPFDRWRESPWGRSLLPFDLYNNMMQKKNENYIPWSSSRYDWDKVKERIQKHGLRNTFFLALMPTASTAHISGSNEAFEPWTQNCYLRSLLSGEFLVVNDDLVNDLIKLGIWDERTQRHFKQNDGSIANLEINTDIYKWWNPKKHKEYKRLQEIYMTAFEIPMKYQIKMAAERQKFVDQAQSFNFFCNKLDYNYITAFHFSGWRQGLKTGMYYFRGKPVTENMNQQNKLDELTNKSQQATICVLDRESGCVSCQ